MNPHPERHRFPPRDWFRGGSLEDSTTCGHAAPAANPPDQAVILAGGRGMRMRPLTDTRPKPMIEVCGRPFLEYLIGMLRQQGIRRILLLLGYLPEVIQNHFDDGRRFGLDIEYAVSRAEDLTVERMRGVRDRLDEHFLLLYCDNYWPMNLRAMWEQFRRHCAPAQVTVYRNDDAYSRSNVLLGPRGYVRAFDRTRQVRGLKGVEIGYSLLHRSALSLLPTEDQLFEHAVYPQLAARGRLAAFLTDHRYYGVGSMRRLSVAHRFFAQPPTVFLDRDGVLNRRPPKAEYVRSPDQFIWLDGAKQALRLLHQAGWRTVLVSNQAGVGRGVMSEAQLAALHAWMSFEIAEAGGRMDAIYCCTHSWDAMCSCRKPKPGLIFQAQHDLNLDLSRSILIGDDACDVQAATAAGVPHRLVDHERTLLDITRELLRAPAPDPEVAPLRCVH